MRSMNKDKNRDEEFLKYKPIIIHNDFYIEDDNVIIFIKRKDKWSLFLNWLTKKERTKYIHLDKIGSYFWNSCDKDQSIDEIIKKMEIQFHDSYDSMKNRVSRFATHLYKENLITFKEN